MPSLLEKYRHDGNRYWFKHPEGRWLMNPAADIAFRIARDLGITKKEAAALRDSLKDLSRTVDDPAWREEVAWHKFTKGRSLYVVFDRIIFIDLSTRVTTRSMKIVDFNRVLRERCPSKRQVSEEGGFGQLDL